MGKARSRVGRSRKRTGARGSTEGRQVIAGLREALAFERGAPNAARFHPAPISILRADAEPAPEFSAGDIVSIREALGVSQTVFARLLNVSPSTTRAWEQGINTPGGPASRLLQVAAADPRAILRYLRSVSPRAG